MSVIKLHDLKPAPGEKTAKTRVAVVKVPRVRPRAAAPRAPSP